MLAKSASSGCFNRHSTICRTIGAKLAAFVPRCNRWTGPLSHIRVLDLSRVLAGPWCAQNLADLGADVIKIERPGRRRRFARLRPALAEGRATASDTAEAAYYLAANRGKQSITLDIATPGRPGDRARAGAHARRADRELQVRRPGALRPGLRRPAARSIRDLVYCSVTGFGQTGPYRERAGYDFMIQGMGGLMSVTGEPDDLPGGGPQQAGVPIADIITGMYATIAHAAPRSRIATARARASTSTSRCSTRRSRCSPTRTRTTSRRGKPPERIGNAHPNIVPYQTFKTADGAHHPRRAATTICSASSATPPASPH